MQLNGLKNLFKSMINHDISRYRFEYKYGDGDRAFNVFFFIDEEPFKLLFGAKGDRFSFIINVDKYFSINPMLDKNVYKKLCNFLGIVYQKGNPFRTKKFFEDFDSKIPQEANKNNIVESYHIAKYINLSEEKDKIYFVCWRDNSLTGKKVSASNLEKTRKLLGYKAYIFCKKKNLSTCWTDDPKKAKKSYLPK